MGLIIEQSSMWWFWCGCDDDMNCRETNSSVILRVQWEVECCKRAVFRNQKYTLKLNICIHVRKCVYMSVCVGV